MKLLNIYNKILSEDIDNGFDVGDSKNIKGKIHTITDIDPETQSITWDIKKNLNDDDIHNELTKLINFLMNRKEEYYDYKRLNRLLQKLKFIRNTFKRSSK